MQQPPDYLLPFMHTMETTVLEIWAEFPALNDKDVEFVYEKLKDYYKSVHQGKSPEEPETSSERKQALLDELHNKIDEREEMEADIGYINNPGIKPAGVPITSLAAMYVMCFNRLLKSVQMWRKELGAKGYLTFIRNHVI